MEFTNSSLYFLYSILTGLKECDDFEELLKR